MPGVNIPGLQKTATAAAAVIIRSVRMHLNEVFFAYQRLHHKTQIFRYRVSVAFSDNLTGILDREFNL
jgi:hypothetical protein